MKCTLLLVDAADGFEGEGIAQGAPGATSDLMLIVALTGIEEVGIGRVHPPSISAIVEELLQVLPVDVAGHGAEGVVDLDA